uniref:Uncharacterized protein n=2 Tax=Babesia bovis TaxID=5865 RepID=A7AVP0_BABBO|eukprot:XP_001609434.1 hypothetical protein [Babesia bovis T2Bo]
MSISADACLSSDQDVVSVILEVLTPLMDMVDSFTVELQYNLMTSLTRLPHMHEFAGCLQPFIHNIVSDVVRDPWGSDYLGLLGTACLDEDNLIDLLHYRVSERVIPELRRYELTIGKLYGNPQHIDRVCKVLQVVGLTVSGVPGTLLSQFIGDIVIPNLKALIGERQGTARLKDGEARVCSALIEFCRDAMRASDFTFDELCFGYHLFDLLLVPVKEAGAQPLVLAASLRCLAVILGNQRVGETFVATFTEDVDVSVLMSYLKAERIQKLADERSEYALTLVTELASFIAHVLDLVPHHPRVRQLVDIMYEKGLLALVIDSMAHSAVDATVRVALVRALVRFPLDKIDAGAMATMLGILVPSSLRDFEPEVFGYIVDALRHKLEFYAIEPIIERTCWLLTETLKRSDAHLYEQVHLKCASLLHKASTMPTGCLVIRDESKAVMLRKALRFEQEFCAYDHADIRVELSCVGGDVEFIAQCMFDTFRVRTNSRQIFRVFRALEIALCGSQDMALEQSLQSIDLICAAEVEDFSDTCFRPVLSVPVEDISDPGTVSSRTTVSIDEIDAHRDHEQQVFILKEMPKRIVSYLSPEYSHTFSERYQRERSRNEHSEYWAGILKGRKLDSEAANEVETIDWTIKCSKVFSGDAFDDGPQLGDAIISPIDKRARRMLSYTIGQKLSQCHNDIASDDPFYQVLPKQMLHRVWINESRKVINPCFAVSSFFRTLYGLMSPRTSRVVRDVLHLQFRDPEFVRSLIKLTACSSFLDANITAKLFKLATRALYIDTFLQAESMDAIVVYDVLSRFAAGLCVPLSDVTASVSVEWVDAGMTHVQLVILRMIQMLSTFCRQLPWVKFSNIAKIQDHFVEECVIRCVPEHVLQFTLGIMFQVVALETSNSVGTYVSHLYTSPLLEHIREACADLAVAVSCSAKNTHYKHVLHAISEQRGSNNLLLRPSFVSDLLRRIQLAALARQFQNKISQGRAERVLLMDDIWLITTRVHNALIAVTSRAIYIIGAGEPSEFDIKSKFSINAAVIEVEKGLLHVIRHRKKAIAITLRHTPPAEFRRFVTEGDRSTMSTTVAQHLGEPLTYLGACKHEQRFCLVAVTNNHLAIFALRYQSVLETDDPEKVLVTSESEESNDTATEPIMQCLCYEISKVAYSSDLGVQITLEKRTDDNCWELVFVSDSRREAFKKALAQSIGHLEWFRHWESGAD